MNGNQEVSMFPARRIEKLLGGDDFLKNKYNEKKTGGIVIYP